jgi:alcohol dehydrogenase class IV
MISSFAFAATPQLYFGSEKIATLSSVLKTFGSSVLLVTGARSFISSASGYKLLEQLHVAGYTVEQCIIDQEPTPAMVDSAVNRAAHIPPPHVVVAIGGGSVLDAGKAIAAMLPLHDSVKNYLEGVGTKTHPGVKIPFVAIPTTAGTGSEATKNAVLSEIGENGYKKSLRHNNFVPDIAIIDPTLTLTCPPAITAASGMDAFTQLLESYLSTAANPMTDALAYEGLKYISTSLKQAYEDGSNLSARTAMALASYLSGITLANAGLGLVHGFASAIGGYFNISHGVICSSLMAPSNKITVRKLRAEKSNDAALAKYAAIGKLFAGIENKSDAYYTDSLLAHIESLSHELKIPTLKASGIAPTDFEKIIRASDNKNNPAILHKKEMEEVLAMA